MPDFFDKQIFIIEARILGINKDGKKKIIVNL